MHYNENHLALLDASAVSTIEANTAADGTVLSPGMVLQATVIRGLVEDLREARSDLDAAKRLIEVVNEDSITQGIAQLDAVREAWGRGFPLEVEVEDPDA